MPKMIFHMGVTLRCYGNVEVEAESVEAAFPLLTADYLAENIDIRATTTDSGQDLAIIDVTDADTGEELADYGGHPLPSPYDPPPDQSLLVRQMLEALKTIKRARGNCGASPFEQAACNLMDAAILKAEGHGDIERQAPALPDHVNDTVDALMLAEEFMSGFEGDETQEGVDDTLAALRAAIPREQAVPDMLAALKRCIDQLSQRRPRKTGTRRAALDFDLELAIAEAGSAIAKAEGRTNG